MVPETSTAAPLVFTADDLAALDKARGWARFIAIVGFIGCGLFGLAMLLSLAVAARAGGAGAGALVGVGGMVGVGFGVAYFAVLLRYASGVAGHARGDGTALARAFWGLKVLWIITVVSYGFSIITTISMTVAQLLGYMPVKPG
jgi:hypothetical protein